MMPLYIYFLDDKPDSFNYGYHMRNLEFFYILLSIWICLQINSKGERTLKKLLLRLVIFLITASLLLLVTACPKKIAPYYIEVDNETHYTGKWAHITVTVRDSSGNPVAYMPVAFHFSSSIPKMLNLVDKSKVDIVPDDPIVYTDSSGMASLDGFFRVSGVETVKAYLADYPDIYNNFQLNILTSNWSFLILMGADNNLESSAISDLSEMFITNPGISIIGIADVSSLESGDDQYPEVTDDFLFMLDEEGTLHDEPTDTEVDSGATETLESLISEFYDIESNYKALVLWNHGGAWFDENEPRTRGIIYDDTNETFLRIKDVQNAIISATNGDGFDILSIERYSKLFCFICFSRARKWLGL